MENANRFPRKKLNPSASRLVLLVALGTATRAQERGPTPASPEEIRQAIGKLGDLDYATRMGAGRVIRRSPSAQVVPALLQTVAEHADGYIRYKALTLLTGFSDP